MQYSLKYAQLSISIILEKGCQRLPLHCLCGEVGWLIPGRPALAHQGTVLAST